MHARHAVYAKQPLDNLEAPFSYRDTVLHLGETRFRAHEGDWRVAGTLALDGSSAFDLKVVTARTRVDKLLESLSRDKKPARLSGILEGEMEFRGLGKDLAAWEKTLVGSGNITVRDGEFPSFNIFEVVVKAVLGIFGKLIPVSRLGAFSSPTTFEKFQQDFRISGGRVISDDVSLVTSDYELKGEGSFGLDSTIDYQTVVTLTARGTQKLITVASIPVLNQTFKSIAPVPLNITGTFDKPVYRPDTSVISVGGLGRILKGLGGAGGSVGGAMNRVLGKDASGADEEGPGESSDDEPGRETEKEVDGGPDKGLDEDPKQDTDKDLQEELIEKGLEKLQDFLGR